MDFFLPKVLVLEMIFFLTTGLFSAVFFLDFFFAGILGVYHFDKYNECYGDNMTKEQLKEFESKLLERRQGMAPDRSEADPNPEYGRDEGDRAIASQTQEMTSLRTAQKRNLLQSVDAALSRIRDGTFGQCEHCGQEVGLKRLQAIPWTPYCIACQELLEQYGK